MVPRWNRWNQVDSSGPKWTKMDQISEEITKNLPLANTWVGTQVTFETFFTLMSFLMNFQGVPVWERLSAHFAMHGPLWKFKNSGKSGNLWKMLWALWKSRKTNLRYAIFARVISNQLFGHRLLDIIHIEKQAYLQCG